MATPNLTKPTRITATEAARNFSDLLNRVKYQNESFEIERSGICVAMLSSANTEIATPALTGEHLQKLPALPTADDRFADDLEEVVREQHCEIPSDPWES